MILEYFWLVVLVGVVLWYLIVTILVARKGFTSLKIMLAELRPKRSETRIPVLTNNLNTLCIFWHAN